MVRESTSNTMHEQEKMIQPKSRGKAFFMSLLVPGWGQRYVDYNRKSTVFFGLEVSLWLTYAGFMTYADWREKDYRTYAASHAGAHIQGKPHSFFVDMGNFDNIYEYNDYKLQQRNLQDYYKDTDIYYWNWENEAHRQKFDQLRISADTAHNRATFILGAILMNHIISAIDAVWDVHSSEKERLSSFNYQLYLGDGYVTPFVNLQLSAHF